MSEKKIVLIYKGRRITTDNKLTHFYMVENTSEEDMAFTKKIYPCAIGGRISCTRTKIGIKGPKKYLGRFSNEDLIGQWSAKDRADADQITLERLAKKPKDNKYANAIADLREIIHDTSRAQRKIMLMRIMMDLGM